MFSLHFLLSISSLPGFPFVGYPHMLQKVPLEAVALLTALFLTDEAQPILCRDMCLLVFP